MEREPKTLHVRLGRGDAPDEAAGFGGRRLGARRRDAGLAVGAGETQAEDPKPLPDLAVTAVTIHVPSVGSQPYLVENADGSTQHFDVHVDIENIGRAAAPKSRLRVRLRQTRSACCGGTVAGLRYVGVPGLARGERVWVVVDVANLPLNGLDPLRADADANYTGHIPERTYDNNRLSSALAPVIARQWKVKKWRVNGVLNVQGGGVIVYMDHTNRTDPGFSFRYSRYDSQFGIFYYTASGAITSNQTVDAVEACTGSASGHFSQNPWPSTSYLGIDYGEAHYLGADRHHQRAVPDHRHLPAAPPGHDQRLRPGTPDLQPSRRADQADQHTRGEPLLQRHRLDHHCHVPRHLRLRQFDADIPR